MMKIKRLSAYLFAELGALVYSFVASSCASSTPTTKTPAMVQSGAINEREIKIPVKNGRIPYLAGSLYLPATNEPRPGIVLVQGSGPTDRHWNNKYIPGTVGTGDVLARNLAQSGFVVVTFDKRGVGKTAEDQAVDAETILNDVESALDYLLGLNETSRCKAALVGHSEGAGLTLRVAARRHDIAGLVMLSGMGRSTREILREQITNNVLNPEGVVGEAVQPNLRFVEESISAVGAGKPLPVPENEVHPKILELVRLMTSSPRAKTLASGFDESPGDYLKQVKAPVMIVGGGKDLQIRRSDFDALRAAAVDAEALFLDDMDHVLKVETRSAEGIPGDKLVVWYGEPRPLPPKLLDALSRFLLRHLTSNGRCSAQ